MEGQLIKKQTISIKGEIIEEIPNNNKKSYDKAFRAGGSSNVITIPSRWQISLGIDEGLVEKKLIKVRIPYKKIGKMDILYYETHLMVVATSGFPFDKLVDV
jgi:hypothetical protein